MRCDCRQQDRLFYFLVGFASCVVVWRVAVDVDVIEDAMVRFDRPVPFVLLLDCCSAADIAACLSFCAMRAASSA